MSAIEVKCTNVIKHGQIKIGKQRYFYQNCIQSFLLNCTYNACKPETEFIFGEKFSITSFFV